MSRRPQPNVDAELARLDELPADRAAKVEALKHALSGHYRVAAKAARAAEDALLYELVPTLLSSYARLLDKPLKQDPSCFAKKAFARALVALDCNDVEFFLRGVRYRQLEPVGRNGRYGRRRARELRDGPRRVGVFARARRACGALERQGCRGADRRRASDRVRQSARG